MARKTDRLLSHVSQGTWRGNCRGNSYMRLTALTITEVGAIVDFHKRLLSVLVRLLRNRPTSSL